MARRDPGGAGGERGASVAQGRVGTWRPGATGMEWKKGGVEGIAYLGLGSKEHESTTKGALNGRMVRSQGSGAFPAIEGLEFKP